MPFGKEYGASRQFEREINLKENLNFELTEYLLQSDYFQLGETELTLILNLSLPSSSFLPSFTHILEAEEFVGF